MKANGNNDFKNEGQILLFHYTANTTTAFAEVENNCCRDGKAKESHLPTKLSSTEAESNMRVSYTCFSFTLPFRACFFFTLPLLQCRFIIASEPPYYGYNTCMYCCTHAHAYAWNIPCCLLAGSIGIGAGVARTLPIM